MFDSLFDQIGAAASLSASHRLGGTPLGMWAVSQLARGTFGVKSRNSQHNTELGQDSVVTEYLVSLEFFANPDCKTVMNTEIGGPLVGQLIVINADGTPTERGFHSGSFTWGRNREINGVLSGVSNAGTHREPLYDAVSFDQPGQFLGRLDGTFEHAVLGRCVLTAAYCLDLDDPDDDSTTDVQGVLEGIVITGSSPKTDDSVGP